MAEPARSAATYDELCSLPPSMLGQIVYGVLQGWTILIAPELHIDGHVLVPDLAGWRKERMPALPVDKAYFELSPDWVCEVLSPSTGALDRGDKRRAYGECGVKWIWLVDPEAQTLEVLELDGATYRLLEVYTGKQLVRAVPFDAVELELAALWVP